MKILLHNQILNKELRRFNDIGFVPTMGGIHKGHISLIRKSKKNCKKTIVSIFINPKQFNNKKDFKTYPNNIKKVEKSSKKSNKSSYSKKKKIKKNILNGIAYVQSTFNNTIISIADTNGNVISWASAGQKGFKGSRKSTPYAAQIAADAAASKAMEYGMKTLSVEVKGPGSGRETALRALQARGFKILSIKDTTPMPHNGVRPPKKRRV